MVTVNDLVAVPATPGVQTLPGYLPLIVSAKRCSFPVASAANACIVSGLKQHKFVVLWLCRVQVQHRSHWAKNPDVARAAFLLEGPEQNLLRCLCQLPETAPPTTLGSWALPSCSKPAVVGWVLLTW